MDIAHIRERSMFSSTFTSTTNAILIGRLNRLQQQLRNLSFPTRQQYTAAVYSALNAVLALNYNMVPLVPILRNGPAVVGDVQSNLEVLNNNAQDVVAEITDLESQAAELYNLVAMTQNAVRQNLREQLLISTPTCYTESFINSKNLDSSNTSASFDYSTGLATPTLQSDTPISPSDIEVGPASVGSAVAGQGVDNLMAPQIGTFMAWSGPILELLVSFSSAQIINRLTIVQDNYQGMRLVGLTGSADGVTYNDILQDLLVDQLNIGGSSGKFSGDVVLDFQPRNIKQIQLTLEDTTGQDYIALRSLGFNQRVYAATGQVQSNAIASPAGNALFTTLQNPSNPVVSITHMVSFDKVNFQAVQPGTVVQLTSSPFWYRASMNRNANAVQQSTGLVNTSTDPQINENYTVTQTTSLDLGNNIMQRTVLFGSITGQVTFQDIPLPGTFSVWQGTVQIPSSNYSFSNNVLSFPGAMTNVTVIYQASYSGTSGIQALMNYYSAYLYEIQFQQV